MRSPSPRRAFAALAALALCLAFSPTTDEGRAGPPKAKDGKPRFTNRLAKETSPYLLMHAHNPVDWYAWGPEAFAKAKKENKLIFLSVGYSSCYWCHVMERECFANEEVAKLMNQWYVCIKVDREERPDVDQIYMTALTALHRGRGGWPMSMFLTPDGKPIDGGTYWPREDRVIDGETAPGFKSVLKRGQEFWTKDPKGILKQGDAVAKMTVEALESGPPGVALVALDRKLSEGVIDELKEQFDPQYGGFGSPLRGFKGTKFPTPPRLEYLLQVGERLKSKELIGMVTLTLDKMAHGGIYDHLGGGFHRYSTERTWTVPHFEKMLYDNAQLLEVYARAYRLTKNPVYRRILEETLAYVQREMTSPEGGFYSSQDAETHHEEGRSYVWTDKEIDDALPDKEQNKLFRKVYGADGKPNFEKQYHILTLPKPLAEVAKEMKLSEQELEARLRPVRQKVFEVRNKRDQPFLNKIMLAGWSGEMIGGFAEAGRALNEPRYIKAATRAAEFTLKNQRTADGRLLRTYGAQPGKAAKAQGNGYLEDYAFLAHGLLNLYDATGEKKWLAEAQALTDTMVKYHGDAKAGGYYFTASDHEKLFARNKDQYDGAQPSGNSVAVRNLVRIWAATGLERYRAEAEKGFKAFAGSLKAYPGALTTMLQALDMYLDAKEKRGKAEPKKEEKQEAASPRNADEEAVQVMHLDAEEARPKVEPKKESNQAAVKKLGPVTVTVSAPKATQDGKQVVTVTLALDKDWYVPGNPVGPEDLEHSQTTVQFTSGGKPRKAAVAYPPGRVVVDNVLGDYRIYEGTVTIRATFETPLAVVQPLELNLRCRPLNHRGY